MRMYVSFVRHVCYVRLAGDELKGPGCVGIEGDLEDVKHDIIEWQRTYLHTEKLSIPQIKNRDEITRTVQRHRQATSTLPYGKTTQTTSC